MDISQRIYFYLTRLQLDWKDLERDLHICPSTVWRWQKGETRPRRTTVQSIENYLGLPLGCLEGRSQENDAQGIALLADQIVLTGAAKVALEDLLKVRSRERQAALVEQLQQLYLQVPSATRLETVAATPAMHAERAHARAHATHT